VLVQERLYAFRQAPPPLACVCVNVRDAIDNLPCVFLFFDRVVLGVTPITHYPTIPPMRSERGEMMSVIAEHLSDHG